MTEDQEMIWIKGILQRHADMEQYQDVCLSYSYCRLLTRIYFEIPSTEQGDPTPSELMQLLPTNFNKVFSIVDMQLAFLHDYFFTLYHLTIWPPRPGMLSVVQEIWKILRDILLQYGPFLVYWLIGRWLSLSIYGFTFDVLNYAVALFITILVDFIQRRPLLPMYRRTILNALQNYPEDRGLVYSPTVTEWFVERFPGINCLTPPYWKNKIGQYSLMEDYDRPNHMTACVSWFKKHMLSHTSYGFITHHVGCGLWGKLL
ncbi:hypothetical protein HU200_040666 [Digitaria exilis]|uniref:DUF4220 domain-containing protein n=1 Tax=Digitaria exilis TaxID=1010633 RepID=A0A835EER5_9POAL|nr:hypothetical protein HU200_040666 [Digitaria exilis]